LLQGYRLVFNKVSQADNSGKANIEPMQGESVEGVIYTITQVDLDRLDKGEGGYGRVMMSVGMSDGTVVDAWVYVARKTSPDPNLRPLVWYKRLLIEGAKEHGLSEQYFQALGRIEATEDPDKERDRRKRALKCSSD
jgi:cation transport regulator ChaC